MSTPTRARLLLAALAASLAGCSRERVSYAGLDRPLEEPAILVGVAIDATGPRADAGRELLKGLREELATAGKARERGLELVVYDDRSRPESLQAAGERLEKDHGVSLLVTGPLAPRGATLAQAAGLTPLVCAGCAAEGAPREGSFALARPGVAVDPHDAGRAAALWIVESLRRAEGLRPSEIVAALRATPPPGGYARAEGTAPASDPTRFQPPKGAKPKRD